MGWIANKEIKILRDGEYITLRAGEPCPEAADWPNLKAWERTQYVKFVEKDEQKEAKDEAKEQQAEDFVPTKDVKYTVRELRKFSKEQMVTLASAYGLDGIEALKRDAIIELIKDAQGG